MTATNSTLSAPTVLDAAASAGSWPGAKPVTQALLDAERQTKRQRRQFSPEALLGTWRLRFTAPKKPAYKAGKPEGSGFYVPGLAAATLAFSQASATDDLLTIQNQLQVGALKIRFTGPARFLPNQNLLAFDFVRLQLMLGGLNLVDRPLQGRSTQKGDFATTPVAKLPFFAFFVVEKNYVAARGRGGGLALWVKAESSS